MKKISVVFFLVFVFAGKGHTQSNFQSEPINKHNEIKEFLNNYENNQQPKNNDQVKSINFDYGDPPDWTWISQFGGSAGDHVKDIVTDTEGNIYLAGSFSGELSIEDNSYNSIGYRDAFIAKFQDDGNIIWFKQIYASEQKVISAYGVNLDNEGNIYITGYYTGSVILGTTNLPDLADFNLFFARLDENGNYLIAGNYDEYYANAIGKEIETDDNNNIYITGYANSTTNYFFPSLILIYDSNGNELLNYSSEQTFLEMKVVGDHIFFFGTINTPGYIGDFYFEPVSHGDIFLAKSDLLLNFEWAQMADHDYSGDSYGIDFYVSEDENIYVTGKFNNNIILGEHELQGWNGFIAKCSPTGEILWLSEVSDDFNVKPTGICGNDIISYVSSYRYSQGIRINEITSYDANTGSIYQTKDFEYSIEKMNYSSSEDKIISAENANELISLSQLDNSMEVTWNIPFGGNSAQGWVISTATDQFGNYYTYGYASNYLDYYGQTIGKGLYLAKHNPSGSVIWLKHFQDAYQYTGYGNYLITDTITQSVYLTTAFYADFTLPDGTIIEPGPTGSTVILKYDFNGNFKWVVHEEFFGRSLCFSSDYSGNVILSGIFGGTISIGNISLTSLSGSDVFISKYNENGNFEWAIRAGGEDGHDFSGIISIDKYDNIYMTGEFCSENITIHNYSITLNEGDGNILFAKLDPAGNVIWATSKANSTIPNGDNNCFPTGIQTDPDGYTYIKGWHGDSTYFDDILLRSPYGLYGLSYFIAKFDPDGNTLWANSINQHFYGFDYNQMDIDNSGNVYMGAQIRDTIHFGDYFIYIPAGNYDLFVAKYLTDGDLDWVKTMESTTGDCWLSSVAVYNEDNIYVGGRFYNYLNFNNSSLTSLNKHGFMALIGETTGINVFEKKLSDSMFDIFPNPAQDKANIMLNDSHCSTCEIFITDIKGNKIYEDRIQNSSKKIEINVSGFSKGIYLIKVCKGDQFEVKKLVID